jgi:hypothetical protein
MAQVSALRTTVELQRLLELDTVWQLLRADNAPVIVAVLGEHLGANERRRPAEELIELVDADLEELRAQGMTLPLNASGYCASWRASGYLIRRAADQARGETFELSAAAQVAIRMLGELEKPTTSVTESRLSSISSQLAQLAIDTDPDATRRLAALHTQRDRIDAQIEAVHAGESEPLGAVRASERLRDILAQTVELPADFARVRGRFEELNRELRLSILESDESQRTVLDDVFRGVDHLSASDEGRTFEAFTALVLDDSVGSAVDDDIANILKRDFADAITAGDRRALRRFVPDLKQRSAEIHDVITSFARGLRRYVQSQDYQRDRVLRRMLREGLASGAAVADHIRSFHPTSVHLNLSAVPLSSVGSVSLHDPSEYDATSPIEVHDVQQADWESLKAIARDTEIDYAELTDNVNTVLDELLSCTVADVLTRYPATQGVASIVGLMALAAMQGVPGEGYDRVQWTGGDGVTRGASLPGWKFVGRVQ